MIIYKKPFRISLFGGGSDIPEFFNEYGGQVLSTTINKYCYVSARELPPYFDHSIRLAYSRIETCKQFEEIQHPLLRVALKDFSRNNIEIHYDSDLPGRSGIGSSSSFGIGLASCLSLMEGRHLSKEELAKRVINWERNILKENGGYQDQIAAAYGGINHIQFYSPNSFKVDKINLSGEILSAILDRMILFYIPTSRMSSDVSVSRYISDKDVSASLRFIRDSVTEGISSMRAGDMDGLGRLLHETWLRKRSFSGATSSTIDDIYRKATNAGALGGKILGAGSGGFILIWAREGNKSKIIGDLSPLLNVPILFDFDGSKIIHT